MRFILALLAMLTPAFAQELNERHSAGAPTDRGSAPDLRHGQRGQIPAAQGAAVDE